MLLKTLLTICLLITLIQSFTLEGNWIIQSFKQTPTKISVSITEFVFRSTQVMNRLTFKSCTTLDYQAEVDQNNLWINFDSERVGDIELCNEEQQYLLSGIQQSIREVLFFEIRGQQLLFNDPYGNQVMHFIRDRPIIANNEEGSWNFRFQTNSLQSYIAQIKNNSLFICDSQFDYSVTQPQRISFTGKNKIRCSQEIRTILQSATFFRRYKQKLQIYDKSVSLLAEAIQVTLPETKTPKISLPSPLPPKPSPTIPRGSYFMLLLQRRDLIRVKVDISSNQISFKICNKLIFSYDLLSQIEIKISYKTQVNSTCNKAPQQVYIQYLISSVRYSFDSEGVLTLINGLGKDIISLVQQ